MEVAAAKTAEKTAQRRYPLPVAPEDALRSIMSSVPTAMSTIPRMLLRYSVSPRTIHASSIVRMTLDLSIGTTLLMSPSCNALK